MSRYAKYTDSQMCVAASRISELRRTAGLNQELLAITLSTLSKTKRKYSIPTLSAWETGKRAIPNDAAEAYSDLFGVPKEYIVGLSDDPTGGMQGDKKNDLSSLLHNARLTFAQLPALDGEPVFISFPKKNHKNCWGIVKVVSDERIDLITADRTLSCEDPLIYDVFALDSDFVYVYKLQNQHHLSLAKVLAEKDPVYVVINSTDTDVIETYNGWYTVVKAGDKTFLQNEIGCTLPIAGMNLTYFCFREKPSL